MLIMLVIVTVVISGNGVFAAQRDSYKTKDVSHTNSDGSASGAGAGAANANALTTSDDGGGGGVYSGAAVNNSSDGGNTGSGIMLNGNGNMTNSRTGTGTANGNDHKNAHVANITTPLSHANLPTATITTTTTTTKVVATTADIMTTTLMSVTTTLTTKTTEKPQIINSNFSSSSALSSHAIGIPSRDLKKASGITSAAASGANGINRNTIEMPEDTRSGPYFDKAASKNVTALLGKTAYLNCRVKNMGNRTMMLQVSWVRHRDIHLLTVGRYTYTSDQRFRAIHQPQTDDWMLQIKYPQHRDSGIYECQVSTIPHMSHYIHLTVVEPSTEIVGAPDMYIESGSTINLTCVVLNSPEPPAYIFWNHNDAIINYDSPRGGVAVVTNKGETTTSFLLMKSARPSDSGHYQCNPSNAKPKSVTVHVLNGEFPAAMQHGAQPHPCMSFKYYLLLYLFVCYYGTTYMRYYYGWPTAKAAPPTAQSADILPVGLPEIMADTVGTAGYASTSPSHHMLCVSLSVF